MNTVKAGNELVRVGIIGLGDHCDRSHLQYLAAMHLNEDLCDVTTLGDLDPERIRAAKYKYGLPAKGYTDWRKLASSENVDAVFIMTPDRFHTAQLAGAVALGKHVFCEKPLASTEEEYAELEKALDDAKRQELVISTCHSRRFDSPFIITKEYLDDRSRLMEDFGAHGQLGEVTSFSFNFDYHKPSKHGLHQSLMFDHLNHEVDLMHALFGTSEISSSTKHHDSETAFLVTGVRDDGIEFSVTGARNREEQIYPEDMVIVFENGRFVMNMHRGAAMLELEGNTYERQDSRFITNYRDRFNRINRHFLRSVLRLEQPYITPEEMLINTRAAIDLQGQKMKKAV